MGTSVEARCCGAGGKANGIGVVGESVEARCRGAGAVREDLRLQRVSFSALPRVDYCRSWAVLVFDSPGCWVVLGGPKRCFCTLPGCTELEQKGSGLEREEEEEREGSRRMREGKDWERGEGVRRNRKKAGEKKTLKIKKPQKVKKETKHTKKTHLLVCLSALMRRGSVDY